MPASDYIAGTIGMRAYFGSTPVKITKGKLQAADNSYKEIKSRAKQWVNLKRPQQPPKAVFGLDQFDAVVTALDNPMDANPDITGLPDDLQTDIIAKYIDVRGWLEAHEPAIRFSGGLIAQEIPPPTSEKTKFMWSVDVLNDITRVFDLLDAGCLAPSEAMALRDVYPDFTMEVVVEYIKAAIDHLYTNQLSALSGWQLAGLSALAGVPITSFQDVMTWQMNYEPTGPGRPQGSKAPNLAKNEASDMQALGVPV